MLKSNHAFDRLEILTGTSGLNRLKETRVILFGIGGVGSWAAEALVRTGIGALTIVDPDVVCATNINRQVQATMASVGKSKVLELAHRLRQINPDAVINAEQKTFHRSTLNHFSLSSYPYVIDAIDSLSNKVDLIIAAASAGATVFSALGASNKLDPAQIRVSSLWDSQGCPLGRYLRKRLRRRGFLGEVTCVYSEENLPLQKHMPISEECEARSREKAKNNGEQAAAHLDLRGSKKQINGSAVHITGTFGFYLAGLVVQDILSSH